MISATFTELRNNAKNFFDKVEKGEIVEIFRHGKPVARIFPISSEDEIILKEPTPLNIDGVSLSKAILQERAES